MIGDFIFDLDGKRVDSLQTGMISERFLSEEAIV